MPHFSIRDVVYNVQSVCYDIVRAYEKHTPSLIAELKTHAHLTKSVSLVYERMRTEANKISELKHEYETRTISLPQIYSASHTPQLDAIKHYRDHRYSDNSNTMGDHNACEHTVSPQTQECFDASVVLERNARVVTSIRQLFKLECFNLAWGLSNKDSDIRNTHALFANLMHNRYPALVKALDCNVHSYVFVNELIQLLVSLQNSTSTTTRCTSGEKSLIVNLLGISKCYLRNNTHLSKLYPALSTLCDNNIAMALRDSNLITRLPTILVMQGMLAAIAQREISHILMQHELTEVSERLVYDHFAATMHYHLFIPADTIYRRAQRPQEIAHALLTYRLKHMLHLRITYLLLRQCYLHVQSALKQYLRSHFVSAIHVDQLQQQYMYSQQRAAYLTSMLALSGDIACAIADDILLHMRAKVVAYITDMQITSPGENIRTLTQYLLDTQHKDVSGYIACESIRHSLNARNMTNIIAYVILKPTTQSNILRSNRIFQGVIQDTFGAEQNSEFTKYLCSRAECFIVGLCNDSEFMREIVNICNLTRSMTLTGTETLSGTAASTQRPGAVLTQQQYVEIHLQANTTKLNNAKKAIRMTIGVHTNLLKDTVDLCRLAHIANTQRVQTLEYQLHILNDANSVMTQSYDVQGIHWSYLAVASMLDIAGATLHKHCSMRIRRVIIGTLHNVYRFTIFSAMVVTGMRVVYTLVADFYQTQQ